MRRVPCTRSATPADGHSGRGGDRLRIYTRKGDTGTTGLLFGGDRVSKADLRTDAYGTTDEAVAALGLARAQIGTATDRTEVQLAELVVRLQRELFVVGAELATHVDRRDRLSDGVTRVTDEMVTALERDIDELEKLVEQPKEFVLPGGSTTGAALDLARTIVRRAERRCVELAAAGGLPDSHVLPYLNRLADLLFVTARAADGGFQPVRTGP
ncbi:MAG: cob(I)yrinic acid a,c-diamide adenosyltransferase [Chloroflexi bacterium]|nr:cob(I)yrinic acid a,c-diamide adenosyltransferase [Chloroflexota bacterium]